MRFLPGLLFIFGFAACTYVQKIQDGPTAFERKQYSLAIELLETEYRKEKSRVEKGKQAYQIAESYRLIGQESKSIDWYRVAYDNSYGVDALKGYAYALKSTEQYKDARQAFKDLSMEIGSPYEYRREIKICEEAEKWMEEAKKSGYEISNLPINSFKSDYSPLLLSENQLVFTSDRGGVSDETYGWTGNKFSDLFLADLTSNEVSLFDQGNINSPDNEGTLTVSPKGDQIVFTRCSHPDKFTDNYCQLYESRKEGESWTQPVPLNFTQQKVNYMHPAFSDDGATLFFAADYSEGWGGLDIYISEKIPEGWDEPQLLGRMINSEGNEKFPYYNNGILYFASDYHPGLGGLDIFVSKKTGRTSWSQAENMRAPINSGKDDFGFILAETNSADTTVIIRGYFSSNRKGGLGSDDIFEFVQKTVEEEIPLDTPVIAEIEYKIILEGYVVEKIYENPNDPNSKVLGRRPIAKADVAVEPGKIGTKVLTDPSGFFQMELIEDQAYRFLASKEGYLNKTANFDTKGIGKDPKNPVSTFEIEILLDKIFKNTEITLSNIYYDFNQSFIREDAKPTLNRLSETLSENPSISIQLSSHTDCRGNNGYNQSLSQRRAQAAVDYLIDLGIDGTRLSAVGYGENSPAVDCACNRCTETEHQSNRRTTFKVLD
ncbi:MAG: OmpA family protein [Saprospiraceae bacterium]|nr:OmpA family protein [Saprospiraceae bacterium]